MTEKEHVNVVFIGHVGKFQNVSLNNYNSYKIELRWNRIFIDLRVFEV